MTQKTSPPRVLLRLPEVLHRTGLSHSEVYRRIAASDFPAPVKLGERASAWPDDEVAAWCEARIAERDRQGVRPKAKPKEIVRRGRRGGQGRAS